MSILKFNFVSTVIALLLTNIFLSCQPPSPSANATHLQTLDSPKRNIAIQFRAIDMDKIRIESDSSTRYYERKRNQLKNLSKGHELFIQGEDPTTSRLLFHVFMGSYTITAKNDSVFQLQGKMRLPVTGNWDDGFEDHKNLQLDLLVGNNGWRIIDIDLPALNLNSALTNIDSLRYQLEKNSDCASKEWENLLDCWSPLENYEYALFVSVVSGDTTHLNEYLQLQENFNLAYGGEFSEYHRGNIYYLLAAQIIMPQTLIEQQPSDSHYLVKMVYRLRR